MQDPSKPIWIKENTNKAEVHLITNQIEQLLLINQE
jgi:hypothetical protein